MESDNLYERLVRIGELEEKINKQGKKDFEDPEVLEYRRLLDFIPSLFSYEDLKKYHEYLVRVGSSKDKLKQQVLDRLRQICSPSAYSEIESEVKEVFDEN